VAGVFEVGVDAEIVGLFTGVVVVAGDLVDVVRLSVPPLVAAAAPRPPLPEPPYPLNRRLATIAAAAVYTELRIIG